MKIRSLDFGVRQLNELSPVAIVAELGINHEGDFLRCLDMIEMAALAGADAVKLQTIDPVKSYAECTPSFNLFKSAQLTRGQTAQAFEKIRELGMEPLTTSGDIETLRWVDELQPSAHKISSGLMTHLPLVRAAIETGKPVIISTGMTDNITVKKVHDLAVGQAPLNICYLQCTSLYPSPIQDLNLNIIRELGELLDRPIGFSDHSVGRFAAPLAVAAGAIMIEKHFTFDSSRDGFDHRISLDFDGFSKMVKSIRLAEDALGIRDKVLSPQLTVAADTYLRKIVFSQSLSAGTQISIENVDFLRLPPEIDGVSPLYWDDIVGRILRRSVMAGQVLSFGDIS